MSLERNEIIEWVTQASNDGARQAKACEVIGISAKTFQRWAQPCNTNDGRLMTSHTPKNKLTELERQRIVKISNEEEFANLPPSQIVPILADDGRYIASESSFYRILKDYNQLKHRDKSKPAKNKYKPKALIASAPNQVYTWDITYLPSRIKGIFFYLYLVMDVFSRKVVGWQVHNEELSELASNLMTDICQREGVERGQVTLHSDNGSPMKGATMLATLQELGVIPSFSRPSVSNDNPYSESLFRTLKYRPEQRHTGKDVDILENRKHVYMSAKAKNPSRWSGEIKNWDQIKEVSSSDLVTVGNHSHTHEYLVDWKSKKIKNSLQSLQLGRVLIENSGNIGKSYRRHDEIGTPLCVTVDFQTLEDNTVTVRDRDTMEQTRIDAKDLASYYQNYLLT